MAFNETYVFESGEESSRHQAIFDGGITLAGTVAAGAFVYKVGTDLVPKLLAEDAPPIVLKFTRSEPVDEPPECYEVGFKIRNVSPHGVYIERFEAIRPAKASSEC